jgi:DNA polymerase-3 subunit epsilon
MYLYFDTETTGFLNEKKKDDPWAQPRLCQIAVEVFDEAGRNLHTFAAIVQPQVPIPSQASAVHGITDFIAVKHGISEKLAVHLFCQLLSIGYEWNIAHNLDYDVPVMEAAAKRHGYEERLRWAKQLCTMKSMDPIMQMPPTEKMLRWRPDLKSKLPKLSEAYFHCTGEPFSGAHDALVDTRGCRAIHLWLMKEGHL